MLITPARRLVADADDGLAICGVGDLWFDVPDYDRALGGLPASMPRVLLSHNPDVAEESKFVSSGYRVDLMLSGHLHGGQVWIPGIGAPWCPSYYGSKYARGLVQGPTTRVFTSPGLGTAGLPVRFNATPEISVIELRRAKA
jgi:predicted MPP superfamily phosphohydrolase